MRIMCALAYVLVAGAGPAGCVNSGPASRAYDPLDHPRQRDPVQAQRLNAEGLRAVEAGDLDGAAEAFREAIAADLYHPGAHNNLGLVLLQQESASIYDAAWEFQLAAKLQPHSAEPRHNLGALFERIGRLSNAEEQYANALAIEPDNLRVMGHLARVYIKQNKRDETVVELLQRLAFADREHQWDRWAREWLLRIRSE